MWFLRMGRRVSWTENKVRNKVLSQQALFIIHNIRKRGHTLLVTWWEREQSNTTCLLTTGQIEEKRRSANMFNTRRSNSLAMKELDITAFDYKWYGDRWRMERLQHVRFTFQRSCNNPQTCVVNTWLFSWRLGVLRGPACLIRLAGWKRHEHTIII